MNEIAPYINAIQQTKARFDNLAKGTSVAFDHESLFAMQAIQGNPYLMKIANSNPSSLRDSILNVASIGLSLNPAEKLAYIIPRKGKACLDVSYIGLIKLATDSGSIKWARAELVYENDDFLYKGATEKPEFKATNPFNRGKLIGVYCVAKTKDDDYLSGIMSIEECHDIRNRSEGYKAYLKDNTKLTPWVTDEGEMVKKTIIKRESKTWPKTQDTRLDNAIHVINQHEGHTFDQVSPEPVDYEKVENYYLEAIKIIDMDDFDESSPMAHELNNKMTNDERIELGKKLKRLKHGRKQYSSIWRDILNYDNAIEGESDGSL